MSVKVLKTTVMMRGVTVITLKGVLNVSAEWDTLVMVLRETVQVETNAKYMCLGA